jgi:LuxR family maltose regulon positive regulatory protein
MIYQGELKSLVSWLGTLPVGSASSQPWLNIAHAWTLAYAGEFDDIESLLIATENSLVRPDEYTQRQVMSEVECQSIVGHIATIRAYTAAIRGDMSLAGELADEALQHLPADDLMLRGYTMTLLSTVLRSSGDLITAAEASSKAAAISRSADDSRLYAVVLCDLAALYYTQGRLHKTIAACQDVQRISDEYAGQSGQPLPVVGYAYMRLSAVLREWNDLENAKQYAREGLELCKHWGQADFTVYSYIELSNVLDAIGDLDGALDAIQTGGRIASDMSPWPGLHVAAQQARLWLLQGDLRQLSRWIQESELKVDDSLSFQSLFRYIILARVLIAQGGFDEAVGLLDRLLKLAETASAMGYVIEILVLQASALQSQGKIDLALVSLERALYHSEPEDYMRMYLDQGPSIGKLLRKAAARGIMVDYVDKLLTALDKDTLSKQQIMKVIPVADVEPLSERELEVLRLLKTHLPSTEIAKELTISVNTVRTHIKNIYSKLHVHNRLDAVQRAQELELL